MSTSTPATDSVRIRFDQRVPMRDGVTLSADLYMPAGTESDAEERYPAILTRTPYVKASTSMLDLGRYFAGRGYVFAAMDVRGRGDSEGEFVPYVNDGRDGYDAIEWRDDVLVYVTEPLAEDTEVTGPIRVELYAASSAPDTDFMAKLVDIHPSGFAQRLCDGMVRARFREGMDRPSLIEPGRIYHYTIDCWNTAQVFKVGHRIGLEIASSAFPKYDRNLNTGAPLGQTTEMAAAEQRIYHDATHPSALVLPIIPRG